MGSEGFFCVMGAIVEHAHIAQDLKKFPKEIGIVMHVNLHTKKGYLFYFTTYVFVVPISCGTS